MRKAGLEEAQAGIKIAGRNINNFRYADDTTLMAKWRGTKKPLEESERGEWKSWLKAQHSENEDHGIRSHHFMGNRWGNSGRLYFGGAPKSLQMVTAAMKLKDAYPLEGKLWPTSAYWKAETLLCQQRSVYGFSCGHVWMWELDCEECWALKNWCFVFVFILRTDAFELWCWRRLLRVPWTARRSYQSILKEISPGCSL